MTRIAMIGICLNFSHAIPNQWGILNALSDSASQIHNFIEKIADRRIKFMIQNGRYWIRTSDPFRVKEVRYHCANRPHDPILNHRVLLVRAEEMIVIRRIEPGSPFAAAECGADDVEGRSDQ